MREITTSALAKLNRATKQIAELNDLFRETPPFTYVLETNTATGERATFAKKDDLIVAEAETIIGDVIHNLRNALDHVYWDVVSPFATTPNEERRIQFPFCESKDRMNDAIKSRLADRVSSAFVQSVISLRPYGGPDGNEYLFMLYRFDALDKHRLPVPTGDYKSINFGLLREQVPDFPAFLMGTMHCGMNRRDVVWKSDLAKTRSGGLGDVSSPDGLIFEKKLDLPVEIIFYIATSPMPVIPVLNQLVDVTKSAIDTILAAS